LPLENLQLNSPKAGVVYPVTPLAPPLTVAPMSHQPFIYISGAILSKV
jgi:hypothetical protein